MKNSDTKRILRKVNLISRALDEEEYSNLEKDDKGHLTAELEFEKDNNNIDVEKAIDTLIKIIKEVV